MKKPQKNPENRNWTNTYPIHHEENVYNGKIGKKTKLQIGKEIPRRKNK